MDKNTIAIQLMIAAILSLVVGVVAGYFAETPKDLEVAYSGVALAIILGLISTEIGDDDDDSYS